MVIVVHLSVISWPLPRQDGPLHRELHGYELPRDAPGAQGTGDVFHNKDEQSALHAPLLGHPQRGSLQSACTTTSAAILRRRGQNQPGVDYWARKSALDGRPSAEPAGLTFSGAGPTKTPEAALPPPITRACQACAQMVATMPCFSWPYIPAVLWPLSGRWRYEHISVNSGCFATSRARGACYRRAARMARRGGHDRAEAGRSGQTPGEASSRCLARSSWWFRARRPGLSPGRCRACSSP